MRVLVTGGAGFIGSHLVERLLAEGHSVRVLDDFSTGKTANLAEASDVQLIRADVADFVAVLAAVEGCDLAFHEAAVASVPKTVDDPLGTLRVNYQGTVTLLEAARQAGVRRVVFAASSAAYGDSPTLPAREDGPVRPLSPYAVDKLASEHACRVYSELHGLETVCLRYFNVYGPRQDPNSPYSGVISLFANALLAGRAPTVLGDGRQTRDFVYVADVVEANIRAATAPSVAGKTFNIGTGRAVSILELFSIMREVSDRSMEAQFGPAREGEVRHSVADAERARELLGWQPEVQLEHGIGRLWGSLRQRRPLLG